MVILPTKKFTKQFKKFSARRKSHFFEKVNIFKENRSEYILQNHALHHELEGLRSFSVTGDIRVVYRIVDTTTVQLIHIGAHAKLYE